MSHEEQADTSTTESQVPSKAAITEHQISVGGATLGYRAIADWMTLRKIHQPVGKMFHVAYLAEGDGQQRPLTFVFNGGPGAASAFLHVGAVGPNRVEFDTDGALPSPPVSIVANAETWLPFTDLVFIDPIGTGFSRAISPSANEAKKEAVQEPKENKEFWEIDKDIESLGEFITRFLSDHHRWTSPIFIAGESYGGFRVAKMAKALQQDFGVGLSGAMLISPAIEFDGIFGSDYSLTHWLEVFPSLAAAAHQHGRSNLPQEQSLSDVVATAANFAAHDLSTWLAHGELLPLAERTRMAGAMSEMIGLPADLLLEAGGRITSSRFCRELLKNESRLLGRYDASVSAPDPYRDRESYEGPDPTLMSIDRLFAGAVNHQLRSTLNVETELEYRLLCMQVFQDWANQSAGHSFRGATGAMDDLRYGMSLNEHMRVFISHGYFDLITPFHASQRLTALMKLSDAQRDRLQLRNYRGGHMFYSWDESRIAFTADTQQFYEACLA